MWPAIAATGLAVMLIGLTAVLEQYMSNFQMELKELAANTAAINTGIQGVLHRFDGQLEDHLRYIGGMLERPEPPDDPLD